MKQNNRHQTHHDMNTEISQACEDCKDNILQAVDRAFDIKTNFVLAVSAVGAIILLALESPNLYQAWNQYTLDQNAVTTVHQDAPPVNVSNQPEPKNEF